MRFHFVKILKQKSGIAIMSVLLFFMVLTILIGGLSFTSMGNARVSGANTKNMATFYAAEAGTNRVVGDIKALQSNTTLTLAEFTAAMNNLLDSHHGSSFNLAPNEGKDVVVNVRLLNRTHDAINRRYVFTVESSGQIETQVRTIQTVIEVEYGRLGDDINNFRLRHAVLVRNRIETGNGSILPSTSSLVTRIATISSASNSMALNSGLTFTGGEIELTAAGKANRTNLITPSTFHSRVNQTVLITEQRDAIHPEIRVNFPEINFTPIRTTKDSIIASGTLIQANSMADIVKTVNGVQTILGGNYRINNLNFGEISGTININSDVFIIANRITFGSVSFTGNRMLTIYVNPSTPTQNNFSAWSTGTVFGRVSNPELLAIYVDTVINTPAAYDVTFPNNSKTTGYLMFNNANVVFSQNATLFGSVFTGAIDRLGQGQGVDSIIYAIRLANNSNLTLDNQRSLIVAPNGTVNMVNNSSLRGAIIANTALLGNQSVLTFDPDFPQRIPFEVTSPIMLAPSDNFGINRLTIHRTTEN
jgi:hypothetical protein